MHIKLKEKNVYIKIKIIINDKEHSLKENNLFQNI